jgi:hypothetical protein
VVVQPALAREPVGFPLRLDRLEGQRRLHHHVALDAAETRAPAASALLATLSGTPA